MYLSLKTHFKRECFCGKIPFFIRGIDILHAGAKFQLVEHCTDIAEVIDSNPVGATRIDHFRILAAGLDLE